MDIKIKSFTGIIFICCLIISIVPFISAAAADNSESAKLSASTADEFLIEMTHINAAREKREEYLYRRASVVGGEITDGTILSKIRWGEHQKGERLVLDFKEREDPGSFSLTPALLAGSFNVKYDYYPFRFVVRLNGVREIRAELKTDFNSKFIKDIHRLPCLDDAAFKLGISLEKPVEFEIFELIDPARIVIDLRSLSEEEAFLQALPPVYSLRTGPEYSQEVVGHVEKLDYIRESLGGAGFPEANILKTDRGPLIVEAARYLCKKEAKEQLDHLSRVMPGISFFIEPRGANELPSI